MRALLLFILTLVLAAAQPTGAATRSQVVVSYRQTGGIAGVDRAYTVYSTGVLVSRGKKSRLSAAKLRSLQHVLALARWPTLKSQYRPDMPVADGFSYRITHLRRTIRIEDGVLIPARLERVKRMLASLGPR